MCAVLDLALGRQRVCAVVTLMASVWCSLALPHKVNDIINRLEKTQREVTNPDLEGEKEVRAGACMMDE